MFDWLTDMLSDVSTDAITDSVSDAISDSASDYSWLDSLGGMPETPMYTPESAWGSPFGDVSADALSDAIYGDTYTGGTNTFGSPFGNVSSDALSDAMYGDSYTGGTNALSASDPGIMKTLDEWAKVLSSPGAKLLTSLGGGALSAWDAAKRNEADKKAREDQAAALAARQAQAKQFDSPLRLAMTRKAVEAPAARRGESVFFTDNKLPAYAHGGKTSNYIQGGASGQSDKINARVSPGEYFFDADVVSALGDGNNEAGAAKLDQMRENIRTHKRSAPADRIPPKAKSPTAYLKGAR